MTRRRTIQFGLAAAVAGFLVAGALGVALLRTTGFDLLCKQQILCSVSKQSPWASQIHLSWQQDPSRSLTVSWRTEARGQAFAEIRQTGAEEWRRVPATSARAPANGLFARRGVFHRAAFTGLAPDSEYEYRVSNDGRAKLPTSAIFRTRTAPPSGPDAVFSFMFLSDTGLTGRIDGLTEGTERIRDFIGRSDALFLVGAGDYAYGDGDSRFVFPGDAADEWFRQWQPVLSRLPLMAQYGNHETFLREGLSQWLPRFAHPAGFGDGRAYSYDVGGAHFTAMFSPGDGFLPSKDLLDWLDDDLRRARAKGAAWLIVYQHDSLFGHGLSHPADPRLRSLLMPILQRHGVDLHLAAQDQNYERTYPLHFDNGKIAVTSSNATDYPVGEGVIYAKISPAGKKSEITHDLSVLTQAQPPEIAVRSDRGHHFARVEVRGGESLEVRVFEAKPGETSFAVLDRFTIRRPGRNPPETRPPSPGTGGTAAKPPAAGRS